MKRFSIQILAFLIFAIVLEILIQGGTEWFTVHEFRLETYLFNAAVATLLYAIWSGFQLWHRH